MPTVNATPGAVDANSYITRAAAFAYHDSRLRGDAFTAATETDQDRAVITATALLDGGVPWTGAAASGVQALAWPRVSMLDRRGVEVPPTAIPAELADATAELAKLLLTTDLTAPNEADRAGLSQLKVGPVDLKFRNPNDSSVFDERWGDQTALVQAKILAMIPASVLALLPRAWFIEEIADTQVLVTL